MKNLCLKSLFVISVLIGSLDALASNYDITELKPLDGYETSYATDINSFGVAVGYSTSSRGPFDTIFRATMWIGSSVIDLGTLDGNSSSMAFGINDLGQVVGSSYNSNSETATLWSNSSIINLGFLNGDNYSKAYDINNSGLIVGTSSDKPVLWNGASITNLEYLDGGTFGGVTGINQLGQIAGYSNGISSITSATIWTNNVPNALGTPNVIYSQAIDINDLGQAVGYVNNTSLLTPPQATFWDDTTAYFLDTLGGESNALSINSSGLIVGYSKEDYLSPILATMWSGTSIVNLNNITNFQGDFWVLNGATAINDANSIVGNGRNGLNNSAFLLTVSAVPEPSTYGMMMLGILFIGFKANKKKLQLTIN